MILSASENWLALIGEASDPSHSIKHLNGLTPEACQAAFNAQYGAGNFEVKDHGTVITIWSWLGYERWRLGRGESPESIAAKISNLRNKC